MISDKNRGREQKQYSCLKLLVLSYLLKNRKTWLHSTPLIKSSFHLSPVHLVLSVATIEEPGLKCISVPSLYITKGRSVASESSWRGKFMFGNWTTAMLARHTHPYTVHGRYKHVSYNNLNFWVFTVRDTIWERGKLSHWKKSLSSQFTAVKPFQVLENIFMCMYASSWVKERAFIEKVNSRCFCWFLAVILVHQNGTPIWRLHTQLYKGAWNVSANNSETVVHKDLKLGQIVYVLVF